MAELTEPYIQTTELAGVLIIRRPAFSDSRGFFREVVRKNDLEAALGFPFELAQTNHSRSEQHTLRGIHIAPWHKLVTVLHGQVQQVVVDTRENSPTFGKHLSIILGEDNWQSLFIPAGCGNAFLVKSEAADYMYLTTDYWTPGKEQSVIYNDPDLAISWETTTPLVSEKDLQNQILREVFPHKFSPSV